MTGLYGKDDLECADIDVVMDTCGELWPMMPAIYKEDDPVKKVYKVTYEK